ncbi:MAG: transglutaminase family protein [Granulosicoccus sp.]|nr:transglutaminase family protein [Granulosicoccus sp.]
MSIKVALDHTTVYSYDKPVTLHPHIIRLRPAPHCRTPILSYSLSIEPKEHFLNWQQDPFGNYLARLVFPEKCTRLSVTVDLVAELTVINPFDFFVEESAEKFPFSYSEVNARELAPYLATTAATPVLHSWLEANRPSQLQIIDALVFINQAVHRDVGYKLRMEPGVQTSEETLSLAIGSCRDSGWLLVEIMRHYGIAARFVSGYLVQLTPDVKSIDGPSGAEADFTDLHAWTEVYIPGAGWVGLDPTSGLFAGEGHIPLACTPQPVSAAPITGVASAMASDFYFHNRVTRFDERPRVTLPYSETEWQRVLDLGNAVDQRLLAQDVRLTMGGEPTFVSVDDMESPEWNNAALGEHKLERAGVFLEKLRNAFAPSGIIAYAQGKWYPGEPTPRWALISHWRSDGQPIWHDPSRLATPGSHKAAKGDARMLMTHLCRELNVDGQFVRPLLEDPLHHLHLESMLPEGAELDTLGLKDSRSRRRLIEQLSAGIDEAVGFMLPLAFEPSASMPAETGGYWISSEWPLRRQQVFLIPGDSPAGLRLPLDSLPEDTSVDKDVNNLLEDNFDPAEPLPVPATPGSAAVAPIAASSGPQTAGKAASRIATEDVDQAPRLIRTTLCVEIRDDSLYIFMPPMQSARSWVVLMACIERACIAADVHPVIEGYEPPRDARLKSFRITPDPGVIEVNIHPSGSFPELVERTETIYEAARESRLGAEKFMVDGRHTGTGGGNHVTMGGYSPADSPFLRRPDLLRSVITYWQHHPSLSYLFSGMFIGPTSQAPRIDEARSESLYELEMALSRLPSGESDKPWLVDRLLRNLLIDVTGNTHRTEICIDKLYSPDGAAGRLGIVELRAFEMPPHARMSIVQALLIRCLVSRFWDTPYTGKLIRWGTELHDRFMLPHYLWQDIGDVIDDLNEHGLAFDRNWLDAFWEFRFPVYGVRQIGDISLELRAAIEPWHVLGEEASASGMARYVDSSLERLQLKVTGLTEERYKVTCNGCVLPLRKTGTAGQFVVGVRYRAWQPTFALHPDLPVDTPLVFDIIDTWNNRSLGGCAYHVADPGGRSYEDVPVNANVAEARRLARFDEDHHTPAPTVIKTPVHTTVTRFEDTEAGSEVMIQSILDENPEYPCTADLRQRMR